MLTMLLYKQNVGLNSIYRRFVSRSKKDAYYIDYKRLSYLSNRNTKGYEEAFDKKYKE